MRRALLTFSLFFFVGILAVFSQQIQRASSDTATPFLLKSGGFVQRNWGFVRSPKTISILLDSSAATQYLVVENPHINLLTLTGKSLLDTMITGDRFSFDHRPFPHRFFIFPLRSRTRQDTLYLTLDKSDENLSYGISLFDDSAFVRFLEQDLFMLGGIAGFYGLAILLSFVLYLQQRKSKFLFFFLYVLFSLGWIWNDMGLLFAEVWPTAPAWHKSSRGFFSSLTILLFALYLRQNKALLFGRPLRSVVQLILLLLSFKFLLAFFVAGGFFPESMKLLTLYLNSVGLLLLFCFIAGYLLFYFRHYLSIRYEVLAVLVYCLFVITLSAKELGFTLFAFSGLYNAEALLFFPLQCLFISLYLYQQIIAERRAAEKELIDFKLGQQQETLQLMLAVEEGEKKRIAQNIHDEVGGIFVALRYQALALQRLLSRGLQQKDLDTLVQLADEGIKKQYTVVDDLLFGTSSSLSWEDAVQKHISLLSATHQLAIQLSGAAAAHQLSPMAQTQLFRILAELLNNTIKHAEATHVAIVLSLKNMVEFSYVDNGKGFNSDALFAGKGLINIKQRVEALQGKLNIASNADGSTITIQIPVHHG